MAQANTATITTEREALAAWSVIADHTDAATRELIDALGAVEAVAELVKRHAAAHRSVIVPTMKDLQREHPELRHIIPSDDEWPEAVNAMAHPPLSLWVKGPADIAAALTPSLAITGSRASTSYGEYVANEMAAGVTNTGATIVSGGSFGIDAAALRGSLATGGAPIVVTASGLARAYPSAHSWLFDRVAEVGGALISEAGPDVAPTRSRFLRRYSLLGAITTATLVVEAGMRSDSLKTARAAIDALHPLGAVPGPTTSVASRGTHDLIAQRQAYLIATAEDAAALVA